MVAISFNSTGYDSVTVVFDFKLTGTGDLKDCTVSEYVADYAEPPKDPDILGYDIRRFMDIGGHVKITYDGAFGFQLLYWKKKEYEPLLYARSGTPPTLIRRNMSSLQRWYAGKGRKKQLN